ncbi:hypothetical protein D9619_008303 [Psilocybe cf. subviscida]|uniref:DUF6534 domain-containing protein n=1 Tax=Psilocybe cf. subviscida TaxID=2480587 RepID=A0A8H5BB99_9AGAR|nr:hypothetical protein D9619_008303 [Psilocybe cf. subviscida]
MSSFTEVAVRLYFSYRVWIMSQRNWYITIFLVFLALAHFSVGVATWSISFQETAVQGHIAVLNGLGDTALVSAVVADWCISLSLIYFLKRSQSGMANTDSIINRIVFYTVNMGLITSCTDITVLVLSLWDPPQPNLYSISLFQIVGNLYANSLLASLNSRISLRQTPSANVALSDFSTFAARSGNATESTAAAETSTDISKSRTQTGQMISFSATSSGFGKRDLECRQWDENSL